MGPGLYNRERLTMCDYSLQNVKSRPAQVGDKLMTRNFGTGTGGFAAPEDLTTAVCLLPGTELAFSNPVVIGDWMLRRSMWHKTAIFRQIAREIPQRHHDALEFPNGETVRKPKRRNVWRTSARAPASIS